MSVRRYTADGLPLEEPLPPGGRNYARSRARRMDNALLRGGDLAAIASRLGVSLETLRIHIHDRIASGWEFVTTSEEKHGKFLVATAGRLQEARR